MHIQTDDLIPSLFNIYLGKQGKLHKLTTLITQLQESKIPFNIHSPYSIYPDAKKCTQDFIEQCHLVFMPDSKEYKLAQTYHIPTYAPKHIDFKNILRYMRALSFSILDQIAKILYPKPSKKSHCIVIKTDAIGDYILFRNFLAEIHKRYGSFVLVGNLACSDLIKEFDSKYLIEFIPIHRPSFLKSPLYYLKILKKLKSLQYEVLINPLYSRDIISEQISKNIYAKEKITNTGDTLAILPRLKKYYDSFYTHILDSTPTVIFEFYRNLEFFEKLFKTKLNTPYILELEDPKQAFKQYSLPKDYATLFIGASSIYRKWPKEHFITTAIYLASLGLAIVICGGKEDEIEAEEIKQALEAKNITVLNLCGKTTLSGLAKVVYNGNHLISNETSCVHIAKAIRHDKVFVVSNGNHFRRFTPYPKGFWGEYYGIYHPIIMKNPDIYMVISNFLQLPSRLDIKAISPQIMIDSIKKAENIK